MWAIIVPGALLIMASLPLLLRPFYIHRGLTCGEWLSRWPGDDAVDGAQVSGTRSITIEAPVHEVWPWITQIGQDRAGFYSYRWMENLVGAEMPDVRQIVPEWSTRDPGQPLVMAPISRFGPIATMELVESVVDQRVVYRNREGAWSFILQPLDSRRCRLTFRGTWVPAKSFLARVARTIVFDPLHYLMEWKMARSVKRLAGASADQGPLG